MDSGDAPPKPLIVDDDELRDENDSKLKKEPLSLEELLDKKKREEEARSKPVFLTKEQRALEAIKRRQEEVERQRAAHDAAREQMAAASKVSISMGTAMASGAPPPAIMAPPPKPDRRERGGGRDRGDRNDRGERGDDKRAEDLTHKDKEKELEAIRERYLGIIKKKRRVRRLNDRKFVFDWDAGEDTSIDYNKFQAQRATDHNYENKKRI